LHLQSHEIKNLFPLFRRRKVRKKRGEERKEGEKEVEKGDRKRGSAG
jgi:hypothetical protein